MIGHGPVPQPEVVIEMLTLFKRLLAYLYEDEFATDEPPRRRRRSSATSHLFAKDSPAARRTADEPGKPGRPAATRQKPQVNPDFDPYNTGKFDRGASWERISKKQR